jgi:catalase
MLDECWRHAKAIGAWGDGVAALRGAGIADTPGVVSADSPTDVFTAVQQLLSAHRVWERFPASVT